VAEHNEIGIRGELLAFTHLQNEGYTLLEKNWRFKRDEIDLIVRKEDLIVFVEVKTRTNDYAGEPEAAVTMAKQKKIVRVAHEYLRDREDYEEVRFDIIGIITNSKGEEINHIEDAFYPSL